MYKLLVILTTLLVLNTSTVAMDINKTTTIIDDARQATEVLQNEFDLLINEPPVVDTNKSTAQDDTLVENNISIINNEDVINIPDTEVESTDTNSSLEKKSFKDIEAETVKPDTNSSIEIEEKIDTNTTTLQNLETMNQEPEVAPVVVDENVSKLTKQPIPQSTLDTNTSNAPLTFETNTTLTSLNIENNISNEINSTETEQLSCVENNLTLDSNETHFPEELADNGCTDTEGNSEQGLMIYKTRIKPYCELSGEAFAKQYVQEDWDDIFHEKEFKMEVLKACPKVEKRYKDVWTVDLYQFTYDYASDSDAIPEC